MSSTAPWLALAVDWDESEMWDSLPQYGIAEESTMGERLAWVCLLCDAKKKGRGGKVTIRKNVFCKAHRLTRRAVDEMLVRAQKCGAVEINGDSITLTGWRTYQQKTGGRHGPDLSDSPGITESAPTHHTSHITHHTSPSTHHQAQKTRKPAFVKPTRDEVRAYCRERRKGVNADTWYDHYESNGWRVGRNPMRDWKAAVRKWEHSDYGNQSQAADRVATAGDLAAWNAASGVAE